MTSTALGAADVAVHEIGHSFGFLDDEYEDAQICNPSGTPGDINATKKSTRTTIPWKEWIKATTPVPTTVAGVVGLYLGGFYCPTVFFRPTFDSKMRSLDRPFEAVGGQHLVLRIYRTISAIDGVTPKAGAATVPAGGQRTFTVDPIVPASATLSIVWRLNGVIVSTQATAVITAAQIGGTAKTLRVTVTDKTPMVRDDPNNDLIDTATWTVLVN